jgi:type IV secretory pathway VirB4 component
MKSKSIANHLKCGCRNSGGRARGVALLLTFLICAVISLPSIVTNIAFRTDPDSVDPAAPTEIAAIYDDLAAGIAAIVSRFVTGSAQSFNQQTNVDLSNKYIVLDISELKGKLLPVGMMIALDYVWDNIKADRTKRKAIFIDEIWQLLGAGSSRQAAEFCLEIFKIIRGYGGGAIAATQDLSDFFSLEDGKFGRTIINNSKNKIILNLEPDEAEYVSEMLKLTRTEIRSITRFERGEALISSNRNKVPVMAKASRVEAQIITTDRGELASLLREKQAGENNG